MIILLIGAWYRYHLPNIALLHGDSGNYLLPPFVKQLINEWHKGERPMAYLRFVYLTLGKDFSLEFTVAMQKVLGIAGAGFLAAAWVVYIKRLRNNTALWHLAGYIMLSIYVSNPLLRYFEQLIGPESVSMFLMCVLIFCLTVVFSDALNPKASGLFLAVTIFLNLYLIIPMPKMLFAAAFLEIVLIYKLIKQPWHSRKRKGWMLAVPHVLYFVMGPLQEMTHKIDLPSEDRTFIEMKQMAFTHFKILASDKNNFEVAESLRDSLVKFFHEAELAESDFFLGFDSDYLMWGKASDAIDSYFHDNHDSIENFYFNLNVKLATKYPLQLTKEILRQLGAFYIPNKVVHKELYNNRLWWEDCELTLAMASSLDSTLDSFLRYFPNNNVRHIQRLSLKYPPIEQFRTYDPEQLPMPFRRPFLFYRWFDYIFILAMLSFFAVRFYERKGLEIHIVGILYAVIALYASVIAVVHTFDINRFVTTIYPFLLVTTCMALAYIVQQPLSIIGQKILGYLKGRNVLTNVILSALILIALLAIAEKYFHSTGKYATWIEENGGKFVSLFQPGERGWFHIYEPYSIRKDYCSEFSYSFRVNNEGLLDKEFTVEKSPGTIRILALGDSFIQGIGAPYDSSCTRQLESFLMCRMPDDAKVEVWNCGIGGSDPFFEYILLSERLLKYNPDLVLLNIDATDISDIVLRGGMERFLPDSTLKFKSPPWYEPIYARSFLVRRIVHDVLGYSWLFLRPNQQLIAEKESLQLLKSSLTDFKKLCLSKGLPFMVSFQPMRFEFENASNYPLNDLLSFCDSAGIEAIDVKSCLEQKGYGKENLPAIYWTIDGHFNSTGYGLFAQCLEEPVMNRVASVVKLPAPRQ